MEIKAEKSVAEIKARRMQELIKPLAEGLAIIAVAAALGGCKSERKVQDALDAPQRESQVVLTPSGREGRLIKMGVLEFQPGKAVAVSSAQTIAVTPLQNAHITVQYFNSDGRKAAWLVVPGCEDVVADRVGTMHGQDIAPNPLPYYYGECDLTAVIGGRQVMDFRAIFVPRPSDNMASSSAGYEYSAPGRTRLEVFESDHLGRTADGQVFGVGVTHISKNGRPWVVGVVLNVVESTPTDWMAYQRVGQSMLLLNPEYSEPGRQRYIGAVIRDAQLTDGSRGDYVVKVYGNMSIPAGAAPGASEWSPVLESDGRVRPENVIMRLERGKMYPDASGPLDQVFSSATIRTEGTSIAVPEGGATTFVALYR